MSPSDLQRMADSQDPQQLEQWFDDGSRLPLRTIIQEITDALSIAAATPHEPRDRPTVIAMTT